MQPDVVDLKAFYEGPLGHLVTRALRGRLRAMWPDVRDQRVLGVGYAAPYLIPFSERAERAVAFMSARQGVHRWPLFHPNRVALIEGTELPLPDAMMDRILVVHGLEHEGQARPFLRELWRVLAPEGRILIVVPNRRGIWARFERSPFGAGHPYSARQLDSLLRETLFLPIQTQAALYFPPSRRRLILRAAGTIEGLGRRFNTTAFAGALLIEAGKQVYAVPRVHDVPAAVTRPPRPAFPLRIASREGVLRSDPVSAAPRRVAG